MAEDTVLVVDFRGSTPVQGGALSDHIPRGKYRFRIEKVEKGTTQQGKLRARAHLTVAAGEYQGKRVIEDFTFPRPNTQDSKFGIQRFHDFLLGIGIQVKDARQQLDLARLAGRAVDADVDDNVIPATETYAERTISRPVAYYRIATAQPAAQPKTAPKPEPEVDSAAAQELSDSSTDEIDDDLIPPTPADNGSAPRPATGVASVDEVDDLFA